MPPSASTNTPGAIRRRAGERALDVTEQLAVDQRLGNRAAVERDEPLARGARRARAARARRAPCRCRSRPGSGSRRPDSPSRSSDARSLRIAADAPTSIESVLRRLCAPRELAAQLRVARGRLHHRRQLERLERLRQVVERAGAHALGRGARAAVAGQHDDRRRASRPRGTDAAPRGRSSRAGPMSRITTSQSRVAGVEPLRAPGRGSIDYLDREAVRAAACARSHATRPRRLRRPSPSQRSTSPIRGANRLACSMRPKAITCRVGRIERDAQLVEPPPELGRRRSA